MKLSEETVAILKNYATINGNLHIDAGSNQIKTWTVTKNIYAKSTIEETLPVELPIYDLTEFLNVLDIFKDNADIDFKETHLIVSNGKSKVKYQYSDPSMLSYPTKDIHLPDSLASFSLSKEDVSSIISVSSKLSAPDVSIKNEDGHITITVYDIKAATGNTYTIDVGKSNIEVDFDIHLKTENLRLLPKDYVVSIYEKNTPLVHFQSADKKNEYFIAVERTTVV